MSNISKDIELMIKKQFNLSQEICNDFLNPLVYAISFEDSVVEKQENEKETAVIITTEQDKLLNRNASLSNYNGHNVYLKIKLDSESIVLDYNFFLAKNNVYNSTKQHAKYYIDKSKKRICRASSFYTSRYEGNQTLSGSEIVEVLYREYDLDSVILNETKTVKRINSDKTEQRLLAEALILNPPKCEDGIYSSFQRLIENQAIRYTSPNNYELVYLNPEVLNEFVILSKPPRRLDKEESSTLKRKYPYKKA